MRAVGLGLLVLALTGCDSRIPPVDAWQGLPLETNWSVKVAAPGNASTSFSRNTNGPVARVYVEGAPGKYDVTLRLSGVSCPGPDGMDSKVELRVDGKPQLAWALASGSAAYVLRGLSIEGPARNLDIVFLNDFSIDNCDRVVGMQGVSVTRSSG